MKKFLLLGIFAFIFTLFTIPSNIKALAETTDDLPEELSKLNYQQTLLANKVDTYLKKYYNNLYPTYFGGIYISDYSKNVVIQIVKSNIPDKDTEEYSIYDEIINIDSALKIEYVNNSYEELNGLNNEINDIFSDSKTKYENLSANGIDIINNKVKIVLRNNNEEEQSKFLNTINNSNLRSYANILEKFVFSEVHILKVLLIYILANLELIVQLDLE